MKKSALLAVVAIVLAFWAKATAPENKATTASKADFFMFICSINLDKLSTATLPHCYLNVVKL